MSHEHLSVVFDHSRQSGSSLAILLVVAAYCDEHGEWTADQPTLQQRARLSRRRVQQILAELNAAGELAVIPGDGRGHRSTYRLLVGPEKAHPSAPFGEAPSAFFTRICAAECALSTQKGAATSTLSVAKGAPGNAFRNPPVPPSPSFPPDPQYSLTPPYPPEKLKQETYGLPPGPATTRQAACSPAKAGKQANSPEPFSPLPAGPREAAPRRAGWAKTPGAEPVPAPLVPPLPAGARAGEGRGAGGEGAFPPSTTAAMPAVPFSPLPFGVGEGGTHGRGAGGEGPRPATVVPSVRPLSSPQSSTFRTNLLLEEHAIPLPSPAQIGLWAKTLGGIEPLLDLLRRLIHAGLATKREPLAYIHRVVIERAARPEPFSPLPAGGGAMGEGSGVRGHSPSWRVGRQGNPLLLAGLDDRRRELGRLIAAKRGV